MEYKRNSKSIYETPKINRNHIFLKTNLDNVLGYANKKISEKDVTIYNRITRKTIKSTTEKSNLINSHVRSYSTDFCSSKALNTKINSKKELILEFIENDNKIDNINIYDTENSDFTKIEQNIKIATMDLLEGSPESNKNKEKIEDVYKTNIFNQIRKIEKLILSKREKEKEITKLQKRIEELKMNLIEEELKKNNPLNQFKNRTDSLNYIKNDKLLKKSKSENINSYYDLILLKKEEIRKDGLLIKDLKLKKDNDIFLLTKYYTKLFQKGLDRRDDGLVWIIYKLLELGYDINTLQSPEYITKDDFEYLKKLGELKIKLEKFKIIYEGFRTKLSDKIIKISEDDRLCFSSEKSKSNTRYGSFLNKYVNTEANYSTKKSFSKKNVITFVSLYKSEKVKLNHFRTLEFNLPLLGDVKPENIISNLSILTRTIDNIKKETLYLTKNYIKFFKEENSDLRMEDFEEYKFRFQSIFGMNMVCG